MQLIQMAHIMNLSDNKYMGQEVRKFRKFQNTSIQRIAKSLHVPPKTVQMLEDGDLINNKLLIKEARDVGMGDQHILQLANHKPTHTPSATVDNSPFKPELALHGGVNKMKTKSTKESPATHLFYTILRVAEYKDVSKVDLCKKAGRNKYYLQTPVNMPPYVFAIFAKELNKSEEWILNQLSVQGYPVDGKSFHSKVFIKCVLKGWSSNSLIKRAHISSNSLANIKANRPVAMSTKQRLIKCLNGQSTKSHRQMDATFRRLLLQHGYSTLSSFAKDVGISTSTLSHITHGDDSPSSETLSKMHFILKIPTKDILKTLPEPHKHLQSLTPNAAIQASTSEMKKLNKRVIKLSTEVIAQKDNLNKYKATMHQKIKTLNQAINLKRLSRWIDDNVHASIKEQLKKNSGISPKDLAIIDRIHQMSARYPHFNDILSVLIHAGKGQLQALCAIVKTWQKKD